jgi:hypothetical protein
LSRKITPVKFFDLGLDDGFFASAARIVFDIATQHTEKQRGRGMMHPASIVDPMDFSSERFVRGARSVIASAPK